MKYSLYAQLRTIYETTVDNPHTFRVTCKMKDMIDQDILQKAVDLTMRRYPYFSMKIVREKDAVVFEQNTKEHIVIHGDGPITLGSNEVNEHLLNVSWWKNKIHLDVYHALTDGTGIYPLIKTLLYYYCSDYYQKELSSDTVRLSDHIVSREEWIDPYKQKIDQELLLLKEKWNQPAFQIQMDHNVEISKKCIVYNIRIPEKEFMRFNISNDGSPGTIIALFLARAIDKLNAKSKDPIVISMCVNQRKALNAPVAHQSLVGDVRLVYNEKMKSMEFGQQATCFRGMVALQSNQDMVLQEVKDYQCFMDELNQCDSEEKKHKLCVEKMNQETSKMSATVSYVGKTDMGEAEFYIQEFHVLPSTALPSSATPLTLELSAINGSFYVNFMQYFEYDGYLKEFIQQLRDNDINYDVLYQEATKYPLMVDLWNENDS